VCVCVCVFVCSCVIRACVRRSYMQSEKAREREGERERDRGDSLEREREHREQSPCFEVWRRMHVWMPQRERAQRTDREQSPCFAVWRRMHASMSQRERAQRTVSMFCGVSIIFDTENNLLCQILFTENNLQALCQLLFTNHYLHRRQKKELVLKKKGTFEEAEAWAADISSACFFPFMIFSKASGSCIICWHFTTVLY